MSKTLTLWLSNRSGTLPPIPMEVLSTRTDLEAESFQNARLDKWSLSKLMREAGMEPYPEAIKRLEKEGNSLAASSLEKQQEKILQLAVNVVEVEEGYCPEIDATDLEWILKEYLNYRPEEEAIWDETPIG